MTTALQETIAPQPGPQVAFSACPADICIFGGQAGGGKTMALLMEMARWSRTRGFRGVLMRRTGTDLVKAGGLWDKGSTLFRRLGAVTRAGSEMDARWTKYDVQVQFRGCEHEADVEDWQGTEVDLFALDEVTHFTEKQFWYLYSRLRGGKIKSYLRASCNPDPDSWVRKLIGPWIGQDGFAIPEMAGVLRWVLRARDESAGLLYFETKEQCQTYADQIGDKDARPVSLTFIPSKLSDNHALNKAVPNYRGNLALMDGVTRAQLLDGNWNAKATSGAYFSRTWFDVVDRVPDWAEVDLAVRGWDIAASAPTPERPDPDWTVGVLLYLLHSGKLVVVDVVRVRESPGGVDELVKATVKTDGPRVVQCFWQDPGGAGKRDGEYLQRIAQKALPSVATEIEVATKNKVSYAKPLSAFIDPRTKQNQIQAHIVRAPWNAPYLSTLEAFPPPNDRVHDDDVDATSRAFIEIAKVTGGWLADFLKSLGAA